MKTEFELYQKICTYTLEDMCQNINIICGEISGIHIFRKSVVYDIQINETEIKKIHHKFIFDSKKKLKSFLKTKFDSIMDSMDDCYIIYYFAIPNITSVYNSGEMPMIIIHIIGWILVSVAIVVSISVALVLLFGRGK